MMNRLPKHLYYADGAENQVETLFVMESPHADELQDNVSFPCVGKTGQNMTAKLCPEETQSLGLLIKAGDNEFVKKYALFETFKFPLGLDITDGLSDNELLWKEMKKLDRLHCTDNRFNHYASLSEFFRQNITVFPNTYQSCFERAIQTFINLKEIVVCGFIAQAILMEVFGIPVPEYNIRRTTLFFNKNLDLCFICHPARVRNWPYVARQSQSILLP
ncbi:hypothetical protein B7988_10855 [Fibrobacter sp. UWB1]|uniref:hypothetical protein n=1 Tax=Fibrobacter sp. UWB1 TaxID=1964355 RepID=UPI000B52684C|nr:hypothetical protein [Fibrobacter sp. UWB1]OWV25348.1 hypothetical protein B7988_10855 [Fibrobacter sp. UWB1]